MIVVATADFPWYARAATCKSIGVLWWHSFSSHARLTLLTDFASDDATAS